MNLNRWFAEDTSLDISSAKLIYGEQLIRQPAPKVQLFYILTGNMEVNISNPIE